MIAAALHPQTQQEWTTVAAAIGTIVLAGLAWWMTTHHL